MPTGDGGMWTQARIDDLIKKNRKLEEESTYYFLSSKKKVTIKSITISDPTGWNTMGEETEVYVDNILVASGSYGGEPEDNMRYRDYNWVEEGFRKIAEALGADVEIITEKVEDVD